MPVLKLERETKTLKLPSMPESEIVMYKTMTAGELFDFGSIPDEQRLGIAIASMIKSWNLTDEKGNPMAITGDIVRKLSFEDGAFLVQESGIKDLASALKKSTGTS